MTSISCIIPAWNAEKFLAEAVASVQSQSHPVDEIIVVDDGSTDRTAEVAAALPGVTLIRQENAGVGVARNTGIAAARGALLSFNDADDLWTPNKIALQLAAFDADQALDLCFGMVEHRDVRAETPDMRQLKLPEGDVPGRLIPNMLVKAGVFDTVGLFDTARTTTVEQEWLLQVREAGLKEVTLPQLTLVRRVHGENMTLRLAHEKRQDYKIMMEKIFRGRRAAGKGPAASHTWQAGDTNKGTLGDTDA